MSFQHFRLGELAMGQPLPPHLIQHQVQHQPPSNNGTQNHTAAQFPGQIQNNTQVQSSSSKLPYGSGDSDDGYTLIFPNLDAFHEWRTLEEETKIVEFVKGDTHGSKAVPPRFKDHTKLVCARHSRSGRKKYVKKHPERVRKVPSRKLEGQGCTASISYKTYFDTDEVRACYISQHSHEIGLANLPFTRRGRKAAVQQEKDQAKKNPKATTDVSNANGSTSSSPSGTIVNAIASTSTMHPQGQEFSSSVSMLAPLPNTFAQPQLPPNSYSHQPYPPQHPHPHAYSAPVPPPPPDHTTNLSIAQDRWERMTVLFHSIRDHARGFEYPGPSVAALESVLIRLYLESPVGVSAPPPPPAHSAVIGSSIVQHNMAQVGRGPIAQNGVGPEGIVNGVNSSGIGEEDS